MSASIPTSSASSSVADGESPPNRLAQHRVEEQHRGRAQRPVRAARLEEVHRRAGQAAQADLARHRLDEGLAPLVERLHREAHADPRRCHDPRAGGGASRRGRPASSAPVDATSGRTGAGSPADRAAANASYAAAPRSAKMTCSTIDGVWQLVADRVHGDPGGLVEREPADAGAERRERDALEAELADAGHRAAGGAVDGVGAGPAVALERDGVDDDLRGEPPGRR